MKINKIIYTFMATAALLFVACSPDSYDLGNKDITSEDLAQGIAYSVDVNQATNTVVLKSLMADRYSVCWTHPQGRSQEKEITLQLPFDGDYEVKFGVETRGGVVYGEPYKFRIDNTNPDLLTDPLWSLIAGGIGESKTWVLDLDASGTSKYFAGPVYFYGLDCYWLPVHADPSKGDEAEHSSSNWGSEDDPDHDCWSWDAGWNGNEWITGGTAADYGTMTFDLINGAHVTVNNLDNGTNLSGTYIIDTENHTISFTDAQPLHPAAHDTQVSNFTTDLRLMSLTEHTMQIAAKRDSDPCLLVFNFITKEAYDNPSLLPSDEDNTGYQEKPVTDPSYTDLNGQLTTTTIKSLSYKVDENAPYDWLWWNGATGEWESNGFKTAADYPSWAPIPSGYDNIALKLETTGDNVGEYTATKSDGSEVAGNYSVTDNQLVLDKEVEFFSVSGSRVKPIVMKASTFYVMKLDKANGTLTLGIPDGKNANGEVNQYLCLNLIAQSPLGGSDEPAGPTKLIFDENKFFYGDIEGNSNFRLEICNQYGFNNGQTYNDPPFNADKLVFSKSLNITFTITGLGTLSEAATATIGTSIDWKFDGSADGDDSGIQHENAQVTGDGTYTVKILSRGETYTASNLNVFVVDILGVAGKLVDKDEDYIKADAETGKCPNVTVTINEFSVE